MTCPHSGYHRCREQLVSLLALFVSLSYPPGSGKRRMNRNRNMRRSKDHSRHNPTSPSTPPPPAPSAQGVTSAIRTVPGYEPEQPSVVIPHSQEYSEEAFLAAMTTVTDSDSEVSMPIRGQEIASPPMERTYVKLTEIGDGGRKKFCSRLFVDSRPDLHPVRASPT